MDHQVVKRAQNAGLDDLNFPFESLFVSKWIQHGYENASKLGNGLQHEWITTWEGRSQCTHMLLWDQLRSWLVRPQFSEASWSSFMKLVGLASFSQTDQFHEAKWSGFWNQTVQTIWLQKLVSPASWSQTDQPNEAGLTTDQPPEAGLTSFEACLTVTHDWMCDLGL